MTARKNLMVLAAGAVMLAGCADADIAQLERTLTDIRQSPGGQPPLVAVELPENQAVSYLYSDERSPFMPPEAVVQERVNQVDSSLAPDQQRTPDPLERFPLQELRLVGTLRMGGREVALIASPDGNVTSVQEGSYLGTDYGRIAQISAQEIRVTERVYTQQDGWQERQVSLVINENNE